MKPARESASLVDLLARELHRQYRAAAKAMGNVGSTAHDHGVRDCGQKKFHYFIKRATEIIRRATMMQPETLGQAEERLNAMILFKRMIVEAPHFIVCRYCTKPFDSFGGVTTTEGYFCYDCIQKIHQITYQTAALKHREPQAVLSDIDATP